MFAKIISVLLCLATLLCSLSACTNSDGDMGGQSEDVPKTQARSYYDYFDTVSGIYSYRGDSADDFEKNCEAVSELLNEYHRLFDIYYEYAGINNLKTVNNNAGKEPVEVDAKLIDFLLYAKQIYELTDGATNIAMGSVLVLWHDARNNGIDDPENAALPDTDALAAASAHTDIDNLIINKEEGTVFICDPLMSIDVGSIGKGYATERAAELLIERGVNSYVLNIGGNIRAIGEKTTGEGWITGITNPDKSTDNEFVCKVDIKDISLVTSGDYERYYIVDNTRYHHIIDPKTNMPADYFSSISIFTNSALADALSTALFCMSYEEGLALITRIGGIDAIWVDKSGEVKMTDGVVIHQ